MADNLPLPRWNRVDFYLLKEEEFVSSLSQAIIRYIKENPDGNLSFEQEAIVIWEKMSVNVPNGGFTQFFYNFGGPDGVEELAQFLDSLDLAKAGILLRDALAIYQQHESKFRVDNPWDGLFGSIQEFGKLDRAFVTLSLRCDRTLEKWIRAHIAEIAADEAGNPIDAQFTGAVEMLQPNGLVSEYLEVKKGKPNGAYRKFFEDGTLRSVTFYKSGKTTGDFWPDGQIRRKEFKRGPHTIIEWYYPSGSIQKRYVKGNDGYVAEPVRLYHENGTLAEEIHKTGKERLGPWLKFFDDGSPQLEAEYGPGKKLIVHNAWAGDRTQVVREGTGVYHDDGRQLDWEDDLFLEHKWLADRELKNGIGHGKSVRYHCGVLWSVTFLVNGVAHGESTTYWNNGRVRSVRKMDNGTEVESQSFPKFDRPIPAVLLSVEANERLYEAWGHIRVDEYPQVLNIDDVQWQLQVPDFLREVHERNLSHSIKVEYEDCNTFNDGIAYFLTVSETGEVTKVLANGSGVYSARSWDIYKPLLQQLRFTPGRIRARTVECTVLARVDHTFVESDSD